MTGEFGVVDNGSREDYNEYVGQYVMINSPGSKPTCIGKLDHIKDGYAFLTPHYSNRVHREKGLIYGLTSKVEMVDLTNADITPTTERSVRALARFHNSKKEEKSGSVKS